MKELKLLSWNINGIRAIHKNGFLKWLDNESPDIICLQETRAQESQLDAELRNPPGYHACWNSSERKGYSGVATLSRQPPLHIQADLGFPELDNEGRVIITDFPGFTLFNTYFPNGKMSTERQKYKMDFYNRFFDLVDLRRQKDEKLILCGDFNTAHKEIDIAHPKENAKKSGFLPEERAWIDKLVAHGFVDIFRYFHKEPFQYTWWDMRTGARERNIGWRIDYFFVTENLLDSATSAFIMPDAMGSDHCPIGMTLKVAA